MAFSLPLPRRRRRCLSSLLKQRRRRRERKRCLKILLHLRLRYYFNSSSLSKNSKLPRNQIAHFSVVCLVSWPWIESEAGFDLVLIETSLLFAFGEEKRILIVSFLLKSLSRVLWTSAAGIDRDARRFQRLGAILDWLTGAYSLDLMC